MGDSLTFIYCGGFVILTDASHTRQPKRLDLADHDSILSDTTCWVKHSFVRGATGDLEGAQAAFGEGLRGVSFFLDRMEEMDEMDGVDGMVDVGCAGLGV